MEKEVVWRPIQEEKGGMTTYRDNLGSTLSAYHTIL